MKLKQRKGPVVPVPLVAEDGLYLWDWGISESGQLYHTQARVVNKFARCFPQTWCRLPERDRLRLLETWKSKQPNRERPSPCIEFNSVKLPCWQRAACSWCGFELLFCIRYVQRAKPEALRHTIAHELGHAMSGVNGWWKQHDCKIHPGEKECEACELQAYSYMAAWGFDPFYEMLPKSRHSLVDRFWKVTHENKSVS